MDLGAYVQIDEFTAMADLNNIHVPRLRGYRLMSKEAPLDSDEWWESYRSSTLKNMVSSDPMFAIYAWSWTYSGATNRKYKKYLVFDGDEAVDMQWSKIHGKKRKNAKYIIKTMQKHIREQVDMFNKYVGRDDVLYIHARIGGNNWVDFRGYELEKEPWFLGRVDDAFDSTYCDIYAKITRK